MIESSIVKGVFLPTEEVAFAANISMTSRIPSVLAFVRAVQENWRETWIPESMAEKIQFRGVSKHYLGKYISSKETWFRIHHSVPDGLGG